MSISSYRFILERERESERDGVGDREKSFTEKPETDSENKNETCILLRAGVALYTTVSNQKLETDNKEKQKQRIFKILQFAKGRQKKRRDYIDSHTGRWITLNQISIEILGN